MPKNSVDTKKGKRIERNIGRMKSARNIKE